MGFALRDALSGSEIISKEALSGREPGGQRP
jgi:hypothetical protein